MSDLKPTAYLTLDDEGSPAMVFLDEQEAASYCDGDKPEPLYTAAQLQEAARHAMERAAQACLEQASKASVTATDTRDPAFHMIDHAAITRCVNAIRALADVAGEKGVGNG